MSCVPSARQLKVRKEPSRVSQSPTAPKTGRWVLAVHSLLHRYREARPICHGAHVFYLKVQELYQLIEGQNTTLCKLRELAHRNQLAQSKVRRGGAVVIKQALGWPYVTVFHWSFSI